MAKICLTFWTFLFSDAQMVMLHSQIYQKEHLKDLTFVLILHFEASPDSPAAEPELYDEKNAGANKKHVYADRAALTVLRESYSKTRSR